MNTPLSSDLLLAELRMLKRMGVNYDTRRIAGQAIERIEQQAQDLARYENAHKVLVAGRKDNEELIEKLQAALYFWLPSITGGGLVNEMAATHAYLLAGMVESFVDTAERNGWITVHYNAEQAGAGT